MDATLIALCCNDRLHIRYVISASGATWEPYQAYCQGDIAPWLDWLNSNMPAPDGSAWIVTKQNTAEVVTA